MADHACNNVPAVTFCKTYAPLCEEVAKSLGVPVENILGLAAEESQWGSSQAAVNDYSFFGMHAAGPNALPKYAIGARLATGTVHETKKNQVWIPQYKNFTDSAKSFAESPHGQSVNGRADPTLFAKALVVSHFNTVRADFVDYLAGMIKMAKRRMNCP
jgi:uncharacterized FlgJ-related protein